MKKITIKTRTECEDIISAELFDIGIMGVEIENNVPLTEEEQKGMFIDFPPELPADNGESRLSFYLTEEEEQDKMPRVRELLSELKNYSDIGEGTIASETVEEGWQDKWKEYFHAFSAGRLFIRPSWEQGEMPSLGQTVIEIDPGMSFGTGKHETTYMVLSQLQKYLLPEMTVLDVGCGSGILSVAARKLGSGKVSGVDIDEQCIVSSLENWEKNGLTKEESDFRFGNLLEEEALVEGEFDLVLANILAEVIIPMAPVLYRKCKKNGLLITSGIIDFKEDDCVRALADAGFFVKEINHMGEWVNITARK